MDEIANRLIKFINYLGISNSALADEIDVQRSGISHILSGRNKPSLEFLHKLFSKYPELNSEWLIMNRGKMLLDIGIQNSGLSDENSDIIDPNKHIRQESIVFPGPTSSDGPLMTKKQSKAVKKLIILYDDDTFHEYSVDK